VWTDPEVEFQGEFYTVPRSRIAPKPLQKPHPPLLIGGYSTESLRRAARFGDGYTGGNMPPEMMAEVIRRFHEALLACGRDPETVRVVSRASFHVAGSRLGAGRRVFWGSIAQIRDDMRRYEECGVTELFLDPTYQPGGGTLGRVLNQMELFAPGAAPVSRGDPAGTPAVLRSVDASAPPARGPSESRRYSKAW
ncbi:MAG: LLM class flavin-dependent oxidoreductase, partial [Actinomycetota bacterium]